MAAGVGKTYRMLQEGRQAQARGARRRDRLPRAARPPGDRGARRGLEVVPRLRARARRRSSSRRWTSTRVVGARPSSRSSTSSRTRTPRAARNEKRYQDIDEILDAGIDVISTLNIQHLESLNDAVFELTGVRVRETFPTGLDEADEVVLVDLSPEALQERLRAGKVYPRGQAERRAAELLPRREPGRAARARAARGRRGRGSAPGLRSSTRSASRRSPSACWRWSSRSRSRSGSFVAPGAPRSGWAARSTRCGCGAPAAADGRRRPRSPR